MTIREARDLLKGELPDSGYEYGFYLNGGRWASVSGCNAPC